MSPQWHMRDGKPVTADLVGRHVRMHHWETKEGNVERLDVDSGLFQVRFFDGTTDLVCSEALQLIRSGGKP